MTAANITSARARRRWYQPRSIIRLAVAMGPTLVLIGSTFGPAAPADASTPYGIIGVYPGPSTPTLGKDGDALSDACNLGDSQGNSSPTEGSTVGSYINDMNAWQGKSSAVISCYYDSSSSLFTDQVPEIWDEFHAVPMLNLADSSYNAMDPSESETSYSHLQSFGTALGQWIAGTDNLGDSAPVGGRRIYIRWDWEGNGTWYSYAPLYQAPPLDQGPTTCSDLANAEVLYVDRWQQAYNAIMNAATAAADQIQPGMNLSNNVAWVYSVNAWPGGGFKLPSDLAGCTSPTQGTASIYEPESGFLAQLGGTQAVTTTGTVANPSELESSMYPMNDYNGPGYNSATHYVQWLGMDGYSFCTSQTPSTVFGNELSILQGISSLPVSIDEVGASVVNGNGAACPTGTTAAEKGAWLTQYVNYVQSANIKMSLPFNDDTYEDNEPVDWAVFGEPSSENGYDGVSTGGSTYNSSAGTTYNVYSEYPEALASSYFVGSNYPSNPQILTNAQFLGQ